MATVLGGVTLLSHIYNLNHIKSKTVGDGQHGTARWANKGEIAKTYRHIPFTPQKWRKQAKNGQTPSMSRLIKKKRFSNKDSEIVEDALPQGIVVGCVGNKRKTTEVTCDAVELLSSKKNTEGNVQSAQRQNASYSQQQSFQQIDVPDANLPF